jgi:hypothetical protein
MEIQILCITKIALWGGGNRPQRGFIWGETALWGRPPYGGDRPMGETALWGRPPPTRFYQEAIERLLSYI